MAVSGPGKYVHEYNALMSQENGAPAGLTALRTYAVSGRSLPLATVVFGLQLASIALDIVSQVVTSK